MFWGGRNDYSDNDIVLIDGERVYNRVNWFWRMTQDGGHGVFVIP